MHRLPYGRVLLGRTVDRESSCVAELVQILSDQPDAQRVEGRTGDVLMRADRLREPVAHLFGRLVRERYGQDVLRVNAVMRYQPFDPAYYDAGLAASGSRKNKAWPFEMFDRLYLTVVIVHKLFCGETYKERGAFAEFGFHLDLPFVGIDHLLSYHKSESRAFSAFLC